jgi:hypothetical protein
MRAQGAKRLFRPNLGTTTDHMSSVSDVSRQPGLAASDGCRRSFARGYRISAGNHDATLSVPSWEFPADSEASRVSVWACGPLNLMKPPARFFRVLFDGLKVATADLERRDPNLIPAALTNVGQLAVNRYRIVGH